MPTATHPVRLLLLLVFLLAGCPSAGDDDDATAGDDDDATAGDDDDATGDDDDATGDDDDATGDDDDATGDDDDATGDDDDATSPTDADGDGSPAGEDCDDADPNNFPGNAEVCDAADNDCDGTTVFAGEDTDGDADGVITCLDCDDSDAANYPGNTELCDEADNDCDTGTEFAGESTDVDNDGVVTCLDCDDADAGVYPGAAEVCDANDNDCDATTVFAGEDTDADGDGVVACADCDDTEAATFPGNPEICDGLNNDCIPTTFAVGEDTDADGDGAATCLDCDDGDSNNFPGNTELCDLLDTDCDATTFAAGEDTDVDGDLVVTCLDCDDGDIANFPGNVEVCDGQDNDCVVQTASDWEVVAPNSSGPGSQFVRGNTFLVTDDTLLNGFSMPMRADAGTSITLAVWSSPVQGGPYTLLASSPVVVPPIADDIFAEVDTGPLGLLLEGGTHVVLGAWWSGTARWTQGYTGTAPDPPWGQHLGTALASGKATLPSSSGFGSVAAAFGMAVRVNDEADSDGDGFVACAECDDDAAASFPSAPEICDGLDNDCDPATQLTGIGFETPTPTTAGSLLAPDDWVGNGYWLDSDVLIAEVEMRLDAPLGTALTWGIYTATEPLVGPWSRVASHTTTSSSASGGFDWHVSSPFEVLLTAGSYYAIGVHSSVSIGHEVDTGPTTILPTVFGRLVLGLEASGAAGVPASNDMDITSAWFSQRVHLADDQDVDGDGVAACGGDCADADADAFPGNPEVACDLSDNDCDPSTTDCVGGLVIAEFLSEPLGEVYEEQWIEVFNGSGVPIDPSGWLLRVESDVWFLPLGAAVPDGGLGLWAGSDDATLNGGLPAPDHCWDGFLDLAGSIDLHLISVLGETVDVVAFSAGGLPIQPGVSMSLDGGSLSAVLNDTAAPWCSSTAGGYGTGGNAGSPGVMNALCGGVVSR